MKIQNYDLDRDILVVAEIGNNHEGSLHVARELVALAHECGVDAVKFQTFRSEYYISPLQEERLQRLKGFELGQDAFAELAEYAHSLGLLFFSTPFDVESAVFLSTLVDAFKVASGDISFYPLLDAVARFRKPTLVSTGASDMPLIRTALARFEQHWEPDFLRENLSFLHCVSSYPAPADQVNLRAIARLRDELGLTIGYSDHTLSPDACLLAAALGARVLEKHFTLDKNYSAFRDHQLSATPAEMKDLVQRVREAAALLGSPKKEVQACEQDLAREIRRSVCAGRNLEKGRVLDWDDLTWLRPGTGIPVGLESLLLGKALTRDVKFGEPLSREDVEPA